MLRDIVILFEQCEDQHSSRTIAILEMPGIFPRPICSKSFHRFHHVPHHSQISNYFMHFSPHLHSEFPPDMEQDHHTNE